MAKKTYNEKLNSPGDLPKVEDLSGKPEAVMRVGGAKMLIAAPMQYNEIMAKIPEGKSQQLTESVKLWLKVPVRTLPAL